MKIAVYCSSVENLPASWVEGAVVTGRWIATHGAQLVYGGVDAGLMTDTARACKEAGGTVVGVVPWRRADRASSLNDVRVPASDLNDRKGVMQLLADAFVVLPGGYGTLDEFATSFGYINFTHHRDKCIILYNPDGLYDHLLAQLHTFIEKGLMDADRMDILTVVSTPEELVQALDDFLEHHNSTLKK